MSTMVLRLRQREPALQLQLRGPDQRLIQVAQADPLAPIVAVIGPPGPRYMRPLEIVSAASITPVLFTYDGVDVSALTVPATINAPIGTPLNWMQMFVSIRGDATPRALSWASAYMAGGLLSLPTETVPGKTILLGLLYLASAGKWLLIASITEP